MRRATRIDPRAVGIEYERWNREFSQPVSSLFDEEVRPRNGSTRWMSAPQLSSTRRATPRPRPSPHSRPLRVSASCSIPSYDTLHIIFLPLCRGGSPTLARRGGTTRKVRRSKASTHHHSKSDGDEKLEFAGWENPLLRKLATYLHFTCRRFDTFDPIPEVGLEPLHAYQYIPLAGRYIRGPQEATGPLLCASERGQMIVYEPTEQRTRSAHADRL